MHEPQDPAKGVVVGTLRHDGTNLSAPVGQFAVQLEFKFASLEATLTATTVLALAQLPQLILATKRAK